ncbi:MAG TPA: hypothetical protein VLH38_03295 [Patescibacteria group bacterium]|nr:hypothetical protein [Patescibacteria group bacterium]
MSGYSQNDPQWAADLLGTSDYWRMGVVNGDTSRAAGCYVTAAADVCKALGHDISPGDLNRLATAHGLINSDGDVTRWDWLTILFPDIVYVEMKDWGNAPADLDYFDIANEPNTEIILMIDDSPSSGLQTHFMRTVGLSGSDVIVDDPWGAVRQGVSAYGRRWSPSVSAKSIIYKAVKYLKGTSQAASQPPAPQGDEMIADAQQAHDAYYLVRGNTPPSDDEINGTAGHRSWASFAVDAKAEVAARIAYIEGLQSHIAGLSAQISQLIDQVNSLGSRPTTDQLQEAQSQATALTTELQQKTVELADLQKQAEECKVPIASPQVIPVQAPTASDSLLESLVNFFKRFIKK